MRALPVIASSTLALALVLGTGGATLAARSVERGPRVLDVLSGERHRSVAKLDKAIGPARAIRAGHDVVMIPGFTRNYANSLKDGAEHLAAHGANGGAVAVYLPAKDAFYRNGDFSAKGRLSMDDLVHLRVFTLEQHPLASPSRNARALDQLNQRLVAVHGERQQRGLASADAPQRSIYAAHSAGNSVVDELAAHGSFPAGMAKPHWIAISPVLPKGTIMGNLGRATLAKIFRSPGKGRGLGTIKTWGFLAGEAASELAIDSPQVAANRASWEGAQRGKFASVTPVVVEAKRSPLNTWKLTGGKLSRGKGAGDGFINAEDVVLPGAQPMVVVRSGKRTPLAHIDGMSSPGGIAAYQKLVAE